MRKILVACVGNFGVEVARRLAQRALPEGVRAVDYGIRSYDLAYAMMKDWDLVILVDAVPRGGEPGTLYVIEPDQAELAALPAGLDAHSMNPVTVLQLVKALGGQPKPLLVVGCEPARIETDADGAIELSAPVLAAVEEAIGIIERRCVSHGGPALAA